MHSISILAYGIHTPAGKAVNRFIWDNPAGRASFMKPIDVREWMHTNPAKDAKRYRTQHGTNSNFETTQLTLLDDPNFYPAVKGVADLIVEMVESDRAPNGECRVVPLYCSAGTHRCDVW